MLGQAQIAMDYWPVLGILRALVTGKKWPPTLPVICLSGSSCPNKVDVVKAHVALSACSYPSLRQVRRPKPPADQDEGARKSTICNASKSLRTET
jgi:hypothetical protein